MLGRSFPVSLGIVLLAVSGLFAKDDGLTPGQPDLKSAGPLAFGPDGILFVGDTASAAVFAVDTGETSGTPQPVNVDGIDGKIAGMLGTTSREIMIHDLAVNPASGTVYFSVSRGRGPDADAVIMRLTGNGELNELSLADVRFAKAELPNAPGPDATDRRNRPLRTHSITDLAYVDGRVFIAGLSNEEFASKLRSIPFPFVQADNGASVEIFHGAHGRFETRSPIRTFVAYEIANDPHLLAAYTCTPLVKFPVSSLKPGEKVMGTTIAELGNRNNPLDMIVYKKDGQDYLLLTNSSRGVMKITTNKIGEVEAITEPVGGGGTAGLSYETIEGLKGVVQMDRLDEGHALILVQSDSGALDLSSVPLP